MKTPAFRLGFSLCVLAIALPSWNAIAQSPTPESKRPPEAIEVRDLVSRAELASALVETFSLEIRTTAEGEAIDFRDVPSSYWAYDAIQVVAKTGVMKGYRPGLFFPNQRVTRAEAFAAIAQSYGVFQFPPETVDTILARYTDAEKIPTWARAAIATALYEGLINVDAEGNIRPEQPMLQTDLEWAIARYELLQQEPPEFETEANPLQESESEAISPTESLESESEAIREPEIQENDPGEKRSQP